LRALPPLVGCAKLVPDSDRGSPREAERARLRSLIESLRRRWRGANAHGKSECICDFEIDDQFELAGCLDRKLARLRALSAHSARMGVSLVTIRHSGAANSVGSLSPRAATRAPQTRARVGEGWSEGRFRVRSCPLHPLTPPLRGDPLPQGERVCCSARAFA